MEYMEIIEVDLEPIEYEVIKVWPLNWPESDYEDDSNSDSEEDILSDKDEDKDLLLGKPTDIPLDLDMILDNSPVSEELQLIYGWNREDKSGNIYLKADDPLTLHRHPVPRSTDAIRGRIGVTEGVHMWEILWDDKERGTNAGVGVATKDAPLHADHYMTLVGNDEHSWGWNLKTSRLVHRTAEGHANPMYPSWLESSEIYPVPSKFLMVLDMDKGTLSFIVDRKFLGVAFSGLKGKKLFPIVSTVWGQSEITLRYMGKLDRQPHSLMTLCRTFVRQNMSIKFLKERVRAMDLPKSLFVFLTDDDRA